MHRIISIFFALLFTLQSSFAQESKTKKYFKSYLLDARDIAKAPVQWNKKQWIGFAAISGVVALVSTQDVKIKEFVQLRRSHVGDQITKFSLEPWGSEKNPASLALMGLFLLHGGITGNERSTNMAFLGIKTYLLAGAAVTVLKIIPHRNRPREIDAERRDGLQSVSSVSGNQQYIFDGPLYHSQDGLKYFTHHVSFPSGHSTEAFAMAALISGVYKEKKWVPWVCYSIAAMTAMSRVYDNQHWTSDVIMGSALGYSIGTLVAHRNNWGVQLEPYTTGTTSGLNVVIPLN